MGTIERDRQSPSQPIPAPIVTASPSPSATTTESDKSHEGLQESYISGRLALGAGVPLDIEQLRERILVRARELGFRAESSFDEIVRPVLDQIRQRMAAQRRRAAPAPAFRPHPEPASEPIEKEI